MYRQLLFVCLFLAIAADLLEAKSSFHKRNQNTYSNNNRCSRNEFKCRSTGNCVSRDALCNGPEDCSDGSDESRCSNEADQWEDLNFRGAVITYRLDCRRALYTTCAEHENYDIWERFGQWQMSALCPPLYAWRDCAVGVYQSNRNCSRAMSLLPTFQRETELFPRIINLACGEDVNVINNNKACLLRTGADNKAILPAQVKVSCAQHVEDPQYIGGVTAGDFTSGTYFKCFSTEFLQCAKNVVEQQCGEDIAEVFEKLTNIVREQICQARTSTSNATKRKAKGFELLEKMLLRSFD